jgi:hypothetical protein
MFDTLNMIHNFLSFHLTENIREIRERIPKALAATEYCQAARKAFSICSAKRFPPAKLFSGCRRAGVNINSAAMFVVHEICHFESSHTF